MKSLNVRGSIIDTVRNQPRMIKGQVVRCVDFIAGRKESGKIMCGRYLFPHENWDNLPSLTGQETRRLELTTEEKIELAAKTGWDPGKHKDVLFYDAFDPSRADAEFVVIDTESDEWGEYYGGGQGSADVSQYFLTPDGSGAQLVTARRLTPSGEYDPSGEKISFLWRKIDYSCGYAHKGLVVVRNRTEVFV